MGNPPFVGQSYQSSTQRAQMANVINVPSGRAGSLDYVAAWFIEAGQYVQSNRCVRIAFVATNSICQGEQVSQLWPILFDRHGLEIAFAHRTFSWGSEARGKAHVHVVIVGLAHRDDEPPEKRLFSYPDIKGDPVESRHAALTAYLFDVRAVANRHLAEQYQPLRSSGPSPIGQQCLSQPQPQRPIPARGTDHARQWGEQWQPLPERSGRSAPHGRGRSVGSLPGLRRSDRAGLHRTDAGGAFQRQGGGKFTGAMLAADLAGRPRRKAPSWTFMKREPAPQTAARRRMERGLRTLKSYRKAKDGGRMPILDSETIAPFREATQAGAVADSETLKVENGWKLPIRHVRDYATHSAATMGRQEARATIGWWQADWTSSIARMTYAASLASNLPQSGANQRRAA